MKEDTSTPTLRNTDIVILITGLTGAGKSQFINTLLGENRMVVGHEMTPCTTELDYTVIEPIPANGSHLPSLPGRRLVIVDTPGFDNGYEKDTEILRLLALWLESAYGNGITFGGVVFLHDISCGGRSSISSEAMTLLRLSFSRSKEIFQRIMFATTKWERIETIPHVGEKREQELQATCWKTWVDNGSKVHQYRDTSRNGAWNVVNTLLGSVAANDESDPKSNIDYRQGVQKVLACLGKSEPNQRGARSLRNTDIVILIAGITGAGRSQFINTLLGKNRMAVGHNLTSCTTQLDYAVICPIPGSHHLPGRRLIVVDTPGFDNAEKNDTEMLRQFAAWLKSAFVNGVTLGGVIYLQDISRGGSSSMSPEAMSILRYSFSRSKGAFQRIILATTKWARVSPEEGRQREEELKATRWKTWIDNGSKVHQYRDTRDGAWDMVNILLDCVENDAGRGVQWEGISEELQKGGGRSQEFVFSQIIRLIIALFGSGGK
ncbi:P-loop containing nucleoside triphosphate hydrolase protein [Lyophyllum atratum]|nr:P-loop containing nucleoside triphosphate hydrolase protein [Lyophyllum atratum]